MQSLILIIDDDIDILSVLKANLELHGFVVKTAQNWSSAEKELSNTIPDLIILDIMLPDGNGVEICRSLRERFPDLPIMMLTARDKVSDKVLGLESGADDYIVKPFETLELIARIKACLRRVRHDLTERIVIDDIVIDVKRRSVTLKGKSLILTPKEYELLFYLVTHRGEVLTRERIRKHLWKESSIYSWSRVIDVHIQHLRQKIEKNPSKPEYIITVPGVGYRFGR
ncbi:MAG: response regulator transcription factor [Thermodesulfovibrionales bacterium]